MKIRTMKINFENASEFEADIWAEIHSADDCDLLIAWIQLVKANSKQWEKINAKRAVTT